MKISIKRLSELSGFSPATVSNALNGRRSVSPETSEKIIRLAREHGYATKEQSKRIRLVTFRDSGEVFSDSPFFSILLESVENESRALGYETMVINLYRGQNDYEERVRELLRDTSSGILLVGTELTEETALVFLHSAAPLVLMDCWFDRLPFNSVLMDNESSVMEAVDYLVAQGHQKIGYLRGGIRIRNFQCRGRGYEWSMREHGLPVDDKYIIDVHPSIQGAYEDLKRELAAGREMPTAFFADNDMIALGAMHALTSAGWRIPEDISIIGFDDIPFSEIATPGLTTIKVYKKELGQMAVRRLIELIRKPSAVCAKIQLMNELVLRKSVAAPRKE